MAELLLLSRRLVWCQDVWSGVKTFGLVSRRLVWCQDVWSGVKPGARFQVVTVSAYIIATFGYV
jgi:hypothetical protein